jgi:uncharacterized protein (TIGR02145 family)
MTKRYNSFFTISILTLFFAMGLPGVASAQEVLTDIDGNEYQTVTIDGRVWMTENLRVTHFTNGDPIPYVRTDSAWAAEARDNMAPVYTFFLNDSANIEPFGNLYSYYVITDERGIAPEGWRVPTEDDWKSLESAAGMPEADLDRNGWAGAAENVAGALQSTSENAWESNAAADQNNSTGFSWVGGSIRYAYGAFEGPLSLLRFSSIWSAGEDPANPENAWRRLTRYDRQDVRRHPVPKGSGMSIRLVKDATTTNTESFDDAPDQIALSQNYPNPFNPSTVINFYVPATTDVRISVFDMLGREVAVLVDEVRNQGTHQVTFDGTGLSSGIYMYRLQVAGDVITRMMTLLK